jgi:uncharacterized phage protein (TIGR02218 family)
MRNISAALQSHLDTGVTTLCWCWRLTRRDGEKLGFTDHDRALTFDGTAFEAAAGFTASDISESLGLNVDNLDVESAFRSDHLSEADLALGLYDDATVEIFRVNWADVSQRLLVRKGSLGEVRRREGAFTAEIRGLAHYLNQETGRKFQFACDADLGDARCGVNLDSATYKGSGTVTAVTSRQSFIASGLGAYAANWFAGGLLTWTTGGNAGAGVEVKRHVASGSAEFELWRNMIAPILPGDTFTVTAGCDKLFTTCKAKFANSANFRGFPHIPGNDYVVRYPKSGDPKLDGSSLFN